jgi:hypothetical protein
MGLSNGVIVSRHKLIRRPQEGIKYCKSTTGHLVRPTYQASDEGILARIENMKLTAMACGHVTKLPILDVDLSLRPNAVY